jgi:hypothetical protein
VSAEQVEAQPATHESAIVEREQRLDADEERISAPSHPGTGTTRSGRLTASYKMNSRRVLHTAAESAAVWTSRTFKAGVTSR